MIRKHTEEQRNKRAKSRKGKGGKEPDGMIWENQGAQKPFAASNRRTCARRKGEKQQAPDTKK